MIYKALFRLLSTDNAAKKLPYAFRTYFKGAEVEVSWPTPTLGHVVVWGMQDFSYVGAISCGWIAYAIRKSAPAGKDPLVSIEERGIHHKNRFRGNPLLFDIELKGLGSNCGARTYSPGRPFVQKNEPWHLAVGTLDPRLAVIGDAPEKPSELRGLAPLVPVCPCPCQRVVRPGTEPRCNRRNHNTRREL